MYLLHRRWHEMVPGGGLCFRSGRCLDRHTPLKVGDISRRETKGELRDFYRATMNFFYAVVRGGVVPLLYVYQE